MTRITLLIAFVTGFLTTVVAIVNVWPWVAFCGGFLVGVGNETMKTEITNAIHKWRN